MSTLNSIVNPQFDILETGSFDDSVSNTIFRKYEPDVGLSENTTQIVINVRDLREYMNLSNSYIEVRGVFCRSGPANLQSTDRPALECGATSLFNQSRLRINQVLVEDNFSLSHHNAFVRQLVSQSKDYNETVARNSGFILDKQTGLAVELANSITSPVGGFVNATNYGIDASSTYNEGYNLRRQEALGGNNAASPATQIKKSYCIRLSDLFSFASVNKVLKGVTVRIELGLRSLTERMFQSTATGQFNITNCDLYMAVVEPSLDTLSKLEDVLSSPVEIPYNYVNWKTYQSDTLNSTSRSYTFSIQSQKPICAFVYAQRSMAAGGSEQTFNSMVYDSALVNSVQMRVNNKLFPYTPYEPVFGADATLANTTGSFVARPYEELLKYMQKNYNVDSGALITQKEWENLYPIYYINLGSLPDSTSYQLTLDAKSSATLGADSAAGSRGQTLTWYLTLCTLAECKIRSDGNGMSVMAM